MLLPLSLLRLARWPNTVLVSSWAILQRSLEKERCQYLLEEIEEERQQCLKNGCHDAGQIAHISCLHDSPPLIQNLDSTRAGL